MAFVGYFPIREVVITSKLTEFGKSYPFRHLLNNHGLF
jgi:hypothetical protein